MNHVSDRERGRGLPASSLVVRSGGHRGRSEKECIDLRDPTSRAG